MLEHDHSPCDKVREYPMLSHFFVASQLVVQFKIHFLQRYNIQTWLMLQDGVDDRRNPLMHMKVVFSPGPPR